MGVRERRKLELRPSAAALALLAAVTLVFQGDQSAASVSRPFLSRYKSGTEAPAEYRQPIWQGRKLYPVDEAAKDPSFKVFRDALLDAVKKKDTQFILNSIAPNIQNDFGGGNGIKNFKDVWKLARVSESKLWGELETILSMGGTFRVEGGKRLFWAPYVYSAWPDDFDCGEDAQCYAVTAENVNVRREPSSTAPIVASLSYDIVKSKGEDPAKTPAGWARIVIPGGGQGYVANKYVRSPNDYRACFSNVKGKWLMTALVAGD